MIILLIKYDSRRLTSVYMTCVLLTRVYVDTGCVMAAAVAPLRTIPYKQKDSRRPYFLGAPLFDNRLLIYSILIANSYYSTL